MPFRFSNFLVSVKDGEVNTGRFVWVILVAFALGFLAGRLL